MIMSILSKFLKNIGLTHWDMRNPDLYPDDEIYNYPFRRNKKGQIQITNKTGNASKAFYRVVMQNQKRFDKYLEMSKQYDQMMKDYQTKLKKGLHAELDQKIVDEYERLSKEQGDYLRKFSLEDVNNKSNDFNTMGGQYEYSSHQNVAPESFDNSKPWNFKTHFDEMVEFQEKLDKGEITVHLKDVPDIEIGEDKYFKRTLEQMYYKKYKEHGIEEYYSLTLRKKTE